MRLSSQLPTGNLQFHNELQVLYLGVIEFEASALKYCQALLLCLLNFTLYLSCQRDLNLEKQQLKRKHKKEKPMSKAEKKG